MPKLLTDDELQDKLRSILGEETWKYTGIPHAIGELINEQKKAYAESKMVDEKMLIASEILLSVGPLKVQASQAGDRWPLQTHEMIEKAYETATKYIDAHKMLRAEQRKRING